jgi:hypothetical protein
MAEMGAQVSLEELQLYRTVGRSLMVFDEQMTSEGVRPESERLWRDAMGRMLRLVGSEIHHLRTLNGYLRSGRLDVKPAVYYFDICGMTVEDRDISDELLRRYTAGGASDCVARA